MKTRGQVTPQELGKSLQQAKALVAEHSDPSVPPGERLREIGKKLKVTRIGAGAVASAGFLSKHADGTFAISYANEMLERRRFTVAHELAHLILDKHHKHLSFQERQTTSVGHSLSIEKAVDRIAGELLMPEALVTALLKEECRLERRYASKGVIDKRKVVRTIAKVLGVSEWAFVLRLQELTSVLAVRLEFERESIGGAKQTSSIRVSHSPHGKLRIVTYAYPDDAMLERRDTWEMPIIVDSKWGRRTIHCHGWRRTSLTESKRLQTWVVGWTWNAFPLSEWDDSETVTARKGGGEPSGRSVG